MTICWTIVSAFLLSLEKEQDATWISRDFAFQEMELPNLTAGHTGTHDHPEGSLWDSGCVSKCGVAPWPTWPVLHGELQNNIYYTLNTESSLVFLHKKKKMYLSISIWNAQCHLGKWVEAFGELLEALWGRRKLCHNPFSTLYYSSSLRNLHKVTFCRVDSGHE